MDGGLFIVTKYLDTSDEEGLVQIDEIFTYMDSETTLCEGCDRPIRQGERVIFCGVAEPVGGCFMHLRCAKFTPEGQKNLLLGIYDNETHAVARRREVATVAEGEVNFS
jgi:hypothetical protein